MKSIQQIRAQEQAGIAMPNEQNQSENESYVAACVRVDEPIKMLQMYAKDLRGMSRKKREARETLEAMRYHTRNLLFMIGKFEEYLQ